MPSKVDVLAIVNDEIFSSYGISGALVCTIDNGMQKAVIRGHGCAVLAAAPVPLFL